MLRIILAAVAALFVTYANADAFNSVDNKAIKLSKAGVAHRSSSNFMILLMSDDLSNVEHVGFFRGIDMIEHRKEHCGVVDEKMRNIDRLALNARLQRLTVTERGWYFVEQMGIPMTCVAIVIRVDTDGTVVYDVNTLSPSGDVVWTSHPVFQVVSWYLLPNTPLKYTGVLFLGESWVVGIAK